LCGDQSDLCRHQQASRRDIPELSGARRDAKASRALFAEMGEGMSARLLVDVAATHAKGSSASLDTSGGATVASVLLITIAGYRSPEGSMLLFDTSVGDLAGTALSMGSLANAFKAPIEPALMNLNQAAQRTAACWKYLRIRTGWRCTLRI
jgi:hypothetical protein